MSRFGIFALTFVCFALPPFAQAEDYTVQIGAFREAPSDFAIAAEAVGEVRTSQTAEGLTRVRIGSYDSAEAAEVARAALLGAGYAGAFVIRASGTRDVVSASPRGTATADPLADLPESIRSRVVLLDGVYHVKDGDVFTPLDRVLEERGATAR